MHREIKYQAIWGRLYLTLGVLFALLFVFGALILADYTIFFNLIGAFLVGYIGLTMLRKPYAHYTETEIIVYGLMGSIRRHYRFKEKSAIRLKNNRLYLDNEKLKLSAWMVDKKDWERLISFFSPEDSGLLDELH